MASGGGVYHCRRPFHHGAGPPALCVHAPSPRRFRLQSRAVPAVDRRRPCRGQEARCQRCRRRGVRGLRPVGVGPAGPAGERRAQPRQVAGHLGLPGPAPRQRQHVRLLAPGHPRHGARGLRHRPLHRRGRVRRPARRGRPGVGRGAAPRAGPVPPLGHRRRRGRRDRAALRGRGAGRGQAHHQQRGRGRLGPAVAFLDGQHARLPRRLCQLAAFAVGGAHRRPRQRHAA